MSDRITRRSFLGTAAAGAAALGLPGSMGAAVSEGPSFPPVKIRKVYLAKPVPTWPKPDLDIPAEIRRIDAHVAEAERKVGDVQFTGGELLRVAEDAEKLVPLLKDDDGVLIFNLTSTVGHLIQRIVDAGKPAILFSQPYAGHDWSGIAALRKAGKKVACFSTSDFGEIAGAARLLGVGPKLRRSRIVHVAAVGLSPDSTKRIRAALGVDVVDLGPERLNRSFESIDGKAAEAEGEAWIRGAEKVVEPTREEIVKSSRMYLAMKKILDEERAQAITIDCLTLFYNKVLPAYPCLGHTKLNDLGLVGACEADIDSTLTMLAFGYAFGVPGFISDPVIDTATNTVIHAHCVSPTKLDGPQGQQAPFIIRSHMEDNRGASLQVKMRVGQPITCAKLTGLNTMLISKAKIVGNPDVDRGCRTKITTEVPSARRLLEDYSSGLHRVIFYGDRVQGAKDLATFMGWKVVEEA